MLEEVVDGKGLGRSRNGATTAFCWGRCVLQQRGRKPSLLRREMAWHAGFRQHATPPPSDGDLGYPWYRDPTESTGQSASQAIL